MKTIVIGDIHGTTYWKNIVESEKPDRVVFIGDYFDGYDDKLDEIKNFNDIIDYKKSGSAEVIMLIGNHDLHYFPEIGYTGTSRYQRKLAKKIEKLIDANRDSLQVAYQMNNVLITHAGVTQTFMNNCFGEGGWRNDEVARLLNSLFKEYPSTFNFTGEDWFGNDITQTPMWVRPESLIRDGVKGLIQIVGHTIQENLSVEGTYLFIDTMQTSREYLSIEGDEIIVKEYQNVKNN